jgi:hypothetical protein
MPVFPVQIGEVRLEIADELAMADADVPVAS